jgi:CheY-like chemotaxis protein
VLIIDDNADQLELYGFGLPLYGVDVLTARTGPAGITTAREQAPDVIVLDLWMPGTSGWDICAALRTDPCTAGTPVIIFTADARSMVATEAKQRGCFAFLTKPVHVEDLAQTVLQACRQRDLHN